MNDTYTGAISLSIFGESHGPAVGATLSGLAAGVPVDEAYIEMCIRDSCWRRRRSWAASTRRPQPPTGRVCWTKCSLPPCWATEATFPAYSAAAGRRAAGMCRANKPPPSRGKCCFSKAAGPLWPLRLCYSYKAHKLYLRANLARALNRKEYLF